MLSLAARCLALAVALASAEPLIAYYPTGGAQYNNQSESENASNASRTPILQPITPSGGYCYGDDCAAPTALYLNSTREPTGLTTFPSPIAPSASAEDAISTSSSGVATTLSSSNSACAGGNCSRPSAESAPSGASGQSLTNGDNTGNSYAPLAPAPATDAVGSSIPDVGTLSDDVSLSSTDSSNTISLSPDATDSEAIVTSGSSSGSDVPTTSLTSIEDEQSSTDGSSLAVPDSASGSDVLTAVSSLTTPATSESWGSMNESTSPAVATVPTTYPSSVQPSSIPTSTLCQGIGCPGYYPNSTATTLAGTDSMNIPAVSSGLESPFNISSSDPMEPSPTSTETGLVEASTISATSSSSVEAGNLGLSSSASNLTTGDENLAASSSASGAMTGASGSEAETSLGGQFSTTSCTSTIPSSVNTTTYPSPSSSFPTTTIDSDIASGSGGGSSTNSSVGAPPTTLSTSTQPSNISDNISGLVSSSTGTTGPGNLRPSPSPDGNGAARDDGGDEEEGEEGLSNSFWENFFEWLQS